LFAAPFAFKLPGVPIPRPRFQPLKSLVERLGKISALAVWLVVLWGAGRGFDFTDEGVYYLSAVHPAEVPDRQTTYFLFGRVLYALSGHSIEATRLLVAGLVLGCTLVFVRGLRSFLAAFAAELDPGGWLGLAAVAGSSLAFATSPLAPSYNLLNAICLLAITGLALQAASSPAGEGCFPTRSTWGPLLGAIVLTVVDFFIKFSTSAVLAGLLAVFFLATSRERVRNKAILVLTSAVVGTMVVAGYFLFVQNFAVWRQGIGGTLAALNRGAYIQGQFIRYADELREQILETLWTYESMFTALFAGAAVLLVFRWRPRWQRWLALAGILVAGGIGIDATPQNFVRTAGYLGLRLFLAGICGLGLVAGLTWIVRAPGPRPGLAKGSWRAVIALVVLALLPFVGSFGTSNDISSNTVYQMAPWLTLITLLLAWLSHSWQARWLPAVGVVCISVLTFGQFINGYVFNPYRVPGGRLAQTTPTSIGVPSSTLRIDPGSHDLVEGVRSQLMSHGFKPGDDIFAFFNLPGLVFSLGGVSPGYPWYFSGNDESLALDAMRANWVPAQRRFRAFVILNRRPEDPPPPWQAMYMDFPNAYEPCGPALRNPLTGEVVEVWKPKRR